MAGESQAVPRAAPDPTVLTTEQLLREIGTLKELLGSQIVAMDALCDEKFRSIDQQLDLVERQRVEQKQDTKTAVDAALSAQKEAVREQTTATATAIGKSESQTSEALKQLGISFNASIASALVTLTDLKDRVVKIESVRLGGQESGAAVRAAVMVGVAILTVAVAVVGVIVASKSAG